MVSRSPRHAARFLEKVLAYDGDDCLEWPFAHSPAGYGIIRIDGRNQLVSRIACEAQNGPPPSPSRDAAHSCNNGHRGCVTKRHLSWKTRAENVADMVANGTAFRGERSNLSKLTTAQVIEIRALEGVVSTKETAARFGISGSNVRHIQTRVSWAWLSQPQQENTHAA